MATQKEFKSPPSPHGTVSTLVLSTGMCMILVWNLMRSRILVGIVGIVILLCLIPMSIGLKQWRSTPWKRK